MISICRSNRNVVACSRAAGLIALLVLPLRALTQEAPPAEGSGQNSATTNVPASDQPAAPVCEDHREYKAWIDHLNSDLFKLTCSTSSWFDGLFGSRRYDQEYRQSNGNVTAGGIWSQRDGIDRVLRFHARLYLPQLSERFHAFIGRVDREEFVSESKGQEIYGLPKAFGRNIDDSTLLGLGYNEPLQKHGSFDADAGVHLEFPLDPYVKGSYRYAHPVGDSNLMRFRETVFWENSQGFGTTTRVDWDHVISDHHLLRISGTGTFSESTIGLGWDSSATLYHVISTANQSAFAYEFSISGSTSSDVPLTDYGVTVIYRQSVWRTWLMLELRTGVDWPRYTLDESRRSNFNAGLAFEMRYGNK
jgi:hypothetical protein